MTAPVPRALSAAAERRRKPPETCATAGCDGKPAITIRAVRLCRDCYAAIDDFDASPTPDPATKGGCCDGGSV